MYRERQGELGLLSPAGEEKAQGDLSVCIDMG